MTYDTIAAIATPPGKGGIGIIRISGPDAERILNDVFRPLSHFSGIFSRDSRRDESGFQWESHKMVYGRLMDGKEMLDEAMAVLMTKSPFASEGFLLKISLTATLAFSAIFSASMETFPIAM